MKSWVSTALTGEDGLQLQDGASPVCSPDQIKIATACIALNYPDVLVTRGLYQNRMEPPFVPGSELSGVVTEVGKDVRGFSVGQRVLTLTGFGAFAEEVLAGPATQQVHIMPDGMSFAEAAAFSMVYGTGMHALKQRGALKPGETMLVLGAAGGCGSAAVEIGKAMGARVIAGASSDEKCAVAAKLGAAETINYSHENLRDRVMALTGGRGADVVFDPVGDKLFDPAKRCVAWNGRYLVVGFAGGKIPTVEINYMLIKSFSLIGVAWGMSALKDPATNDENFKQLFIWYREGRLKPYIGKRYPFSQVPEACRDLHAGKAIGKIAIEVKP